ncbi:hypothetical protein K461DRAFT_81875 [Myriangium duriaei CBS 260.36]|uniref:Distal membrane-arm assembly complex protein 1-like domain-containing protein n=1 Tax=Myriangium duriaei CBS 260.36 TaxID=1168546 RepID=A0A9P4JBI6_9PEZI|nr:hypothetical protein K461DRAFT_81875 [Myriangium duriaei CBS 260.36]
MSSPEAAKAKLKELQANETLSEALRREKGELLSEGDCLSCRVMGSAAFIGLGGYSYWSGHRELSRRQNEILRSTSKIGMPARRMGVTFTSAVLVGLGLYRFFA